MDGGGPASSGQARWTTHAIHRLRSTTTPTSSIANRNHESWNTDTHRMSWKTSRPGGAVAWGPSAAFAGDTARSSAVSATGARTAGTARPIRPKNPLRPFLTDLRMDHAHLFYPPEPSECSLRAPGLKPRHFHPKH